MLMMSLLAGASVFVNFAAAPAVQHLCTAQALVVPVSTMPVPQAAPNTDGHLPDAGPKRRDPAVLLPECTVPPRVKRKRRLSDYPMA